MKDIKINVLGVSGLNYRITEDAEEYNKFAGNTEACHNSAVNGVLYRGPYSNIRSLVAQELEKSGEGIEKKRTYKDKEVKDEATGEVTVKQVVDKEEPDGEFIKRYCAETGKETSDLRDIFQAAADDTDFTKYLKPAERKPKKLPERYLSAAQQLIDAGKAEQIAEHLSTLLEREVAQELEDIARAIQENENRTDLASKLMAAVN